MTPQALTRIEGTILGTRTEHIEALPATDRKPARPAGSYKVADVASKHVRYDGQLVEGLTAVVTVILEDEQNVGAGELVDWLVYPYPTARQFRGQWSRVVGHRFVAPTPARAYAAA